MSLVLVFGSGRRLINVGRFAGQYAKPRSSDTQTRDGKTLPSFRGSNVNRLGFTEDERRPFDPKELQNFIAALFGAAAPALTDELIAERRRESAREREA